MEVRGGVENGGITAISEDYGYEPNGVIHDTTNFPEDTILYFTNLGPIRYIDDDNNRIEAAAPIRPRPTPMPVNDSP